MIIRHVEARWLHCPIAPERQHVSDFGRIDSFDMALVRVETDDGTVGWGEGKAAVGSAGSCACPRRSRQRRARSGARRLATPAGSTRRPIACTTGRAPATRRAAAGSSPSSGGEG